MKFRDLLRLLRKDGWYLAPTRGSHHQFRQPVKPGLVTVAGSGNDDVCATYIEEDTHAGPRRALTGGRLMSRYLVIIEESATGYSAFLPDLPGCIATGFTREEVEKTMREGVAFHLEGLRESGEPVPPPRSSATYVDVAA